MEEFSFGGLIMRVFKVLAHGGTPEFMDDSLLPQVFFSLIFLAVAVAVGYLFRRSKAVHKNLPPGPPAFPIIGNLHLLKPPVHRTLHKISQKYGQVFLFRFGVHPAVIVTSSAAAEECFTKNDIVLANRPPFSVLSKHLNYNFRTISSASYGDYWRNLRRIGSIEIFSNHRINLFTQIRQDEVGKLLIKLSGKSRGGFARVQLKSILLDLTLNNTMRMVAGKRYCGNDEISVGKEAEEFKDLMASIMAKAGVAHVEDYLPFMGWINGGKFEKDIKLLAARTDKFLQGLIDERRREGLQPEDEATGTMIGHLLSLQESQPHYYDDVTIKGLILVILLAGTETTAVTLEWAMSYLVNNPSIMEKAKEEIDAVIGEDRLMEEADVSKLSYLQGIITETHRLQPAAPLLLPHYSSEDCVIGGYEVPRNTMVVVNAWAIHRDPAAWDDPETFRPERFVGDATPESHVMMPFGLGRRACPGSGLAKRVVGHTLGSLIQCFEWRRTGDEPAETAEGGGAVVSMSKPLEVECRARNLLHKLLTSQ